MYRHFMTGWGGSSRFYYMDLSAGPSYWTNELPVQVASQLRGISTSNYYGKLWMSKFVGSYVYGAVNNLFAPDQLYPVNYSRTTTSNCSFSIIGPQPKCHRVRN